MFTTMIEARALAAMALFSAKGDGRERINGVTLEWMPDGRPLLMATDGHRMAVMPGYNEAQSAPKHVPSMILRIEAVNELLHGHTGDGTVAVIFADKAGGDRTKVRLSLGRKLIEEAAIGCDPVEWRQVIPNGYDQQKHPGERHTVGVNADYLASFAKALKVLGALKGGMALQLYGPQSTLIVRYRLVPDFLGIVMPLRDAVPQEAPSWLLPVAVVRAKKEAVKVKTSPRAKGSGSFGARRRVAK